MGVPFFVPGWWGPFGSVGPCGGAYAIRPYRYPDKFAGVRRRPYAIRPYMGTRHSCTRPNLAGIPDVPGQIRRRPQTPLSALLSDSIFAAVFGDAKSDGPVRDVKRESSERLEQCPLL